MIHVFSMPVPKGTELTPDVALTLIPITLRHLGTAIYHFDHYRQIRLAGLRDGAEGTIRTERQADIAQTCKAAAVDEVKRLIALLVTAGILPNGARVVFRRLQD